MTQIPFQICQRAAVATVLAAAVGALITAAPPSFTTTASAADITCVGVLPISVLGQQVTPEVHRCFPTPGGG